MLPYFQQTIDFNMAVCADMKQIINESNVRLARHAHRGIVSSIGYCPAELI